jgi:IS5 family transposase
MSQISFSDAEYAGKRKKTRREVFLDETEVVVPWKALLGLIEPHYALRLARRTRPHRVRTWSRTTRI